MRRLGSPNCTSLTHVPTLQTDAVQIMSSITPHLEASRGRREPKKLPDRLSPSLERLVNLSYAV